MQQRNLSLAAALMAGLLLAACGSDTDVVEVPAAQTEVPASAMASTQALVDWTGAQPASETLDPLDVAKSVPPVSDSDEPSAIR